MNSRTYLDHTPRWAVLLVLAGLTGLSGACAESSSAVSSSPTPTRCQLTLAAPPPVESIGGTGILTLTTQPECVWTATSPSAWISELRPASGQGSARIEFRAAVNPASTVREGEIVVNENRLRVTQQAAPVSCTYTLAPSTQSIASTGGSGSLSITTASGCIWSAVSSASWLTLTGATTGSANGIVTFTVAANAGAERSATISVGGQLATVQQLGVGGSSCGYTIAPDSQTFPSTGGSGGPVAVTTSAGCTWTARTTDAWITVTSGASGTGSGVVAFTVAANTGAARTGSIVIAGQTFQVVQGASVVPSCTYSIAPTSVNITAAGGTATPITVTSSAGCAWTATSADPWIAIVNGAAGSGSGSVTFTVGANTALTPRSGTLTVAGQTFTVNQDAAPPPPPCSIAIAPGSQSVGAAAGTGTTITVTAGPTCTWTAASNTAWLTILTGATGTGNGTVTFRFDANPAGIARTGSLLIGGQTFTVDQAAAPCTYGLNPLRLDAPASGQAGASFQVQTLAGCAWTATTSASWIGLAPGSSGSGTGSVSFGVSANPGAARSDVVTVSGQAPATTVTFIVSQVAAACTLGIMPTSSSQPAAGATNQTVAVTTSAGTCSWSATSNVPWLTITAGASGTGNGQVRYTVAANTGTARTGTLTVAGQIFTVTQTGCGYALSPTSQNHPLAGATMRFVTVTNGAGCTWPWTATSNAPWIVLDPPASGTGAGFITYSVGATAAPRSGTISIAGQTFTVSQP